MTINCISIDDFTKLITKFDKNVEIEVTEEPELRFPVWDTDKELLEHTLVNRSASRVSNVSVRIKNKIEKHLQALVVKKDSVKNVDYFIKNIVKNKNNIPLTIALYEVIQGTEGEFNKAEKNLLDVEQISIDGETPNIPLSRLSAQIGRKIAYQKGYRFSNALNDDKNLKYSTPAEIEAMYSTIGFRALDELESLGYVAIASNSSVIKDYNIKGEDAYIKKGEIDEEAEVVKLNTKHLGGDVALNKLKGEEIKAESLENVLRFLKASSAMLVPNKFKTPQNKEKTHKELSSENDYTPSPTLKKAVKALNKNPLKVKKEFRGFFEELHKIVKEDIKNGTEHIEHYLLHNKTVLNSLFGLKHYSDFAKDKKPSVAGKNLSKTATLDDLTEYWDLLDLDNIHLSTKAGRNARLYYLESILNPHTSKYAREILSSGEVEVKVADNNNEFTEEFKRVVATVADKLDITPESVLNLNSEDTGRLNNALGYFKKFLEGNSIGRKTAALSHLVRTFEGIDFATLLSALQGVEDIRNRGSNVMLTSFNIDTDVTASGGSIMLTMALGGNKEVEQLLTDLGFLKGGSGKNLDDIYAITSKEIKNFIENKEDTLEVYNPKDDETEIEEGIKREAIKNVFNTLYSNTAKGLRDFSKNPTMVLIYRQGRESANDTMSEKLADEIFDKLKDSKTKELIAYLTGEDKYKTMPFKELRKVKGLYKDVLQAIKDKEIGYTLYDLMDKAIVKKYLSNYIKESNEVWDLVKESKVGNNFKVFPAMAVKDKLKHTVKNLKKFGVPLSKIFSVKHNVRGVEVLTQESKLQKTVMDVSQIHSFDTANQYAPIADMEADGAFNHGAFSVHDYMSSTVHQILDYEKRFKEIFKNLASEYDVHREVLQSLKAYDPEIAFTEEFKRLENKANRRLKERKKLLENFDENTDSLIGEKKGFTDIVSKIDVDIYEELNNIERKEIKVEKDVVNSTDKNYEVKESVKTETKAKRFKKQPKATKKESSDIKDTLKELAKESHIIDWYIKSTNKSNIVYGEDYSFGSSTNTITIGKDKNNIKEKLEHEIVHSFTTGYIQNQLDSGKNSSIRYLEKTLNKMENIEFKGEAKNRVDYILSRNTKKERLAELVAVLGVEGVAEDIYKGLSNNHQSKLKKVIKAIKKAINNFITTITEGDIYAKELDIELTQAAVNNVILLGKTSRETNFKEFKQGQIKFKNLLNFNDKKTSSKLGYLNAALASMVNHKVENGVIRAISYAHNKAKVFPLYNAVSNSVEEVLKTDTAQEIIHAVTNKDVDLLKKNWTLSKFQEARSSRKDLIDTTLKGFNESLKEMSEKEVEDVRNYIYKMPLHDYFLYAEEFDNKEKIDKEVERLKTKSNLSKKVLGDVESIIDYKIKELDGKGLYNLESKYNLKSDNDFNVDLRKYLVLRSIQELGTKDFLNLMSKPDLYNRLKDATVANRVVTLENETSNVANDSLVEEQYENLIEKKAVTVEDLRKYKEKYGWKVLIEPDKTTLGVVYREVEDFTKLDGAFTDIKAVSNDIKVPYKYRHYSNVKGTSKELKIPLKDKHKKLLGVSKNPFEGLVYTLAHNISIKETQEIRDTLLKEETRFILNSKEDEKTLIDIIRYKNKDNPWFIKTDKPFYKLNSEVKKYYKPVENASDVKGFKGEVTLVRKDISHWLMGDFKESWGKVPLAKKAINIVKELIVGSKIGMVALNPMKIVRDNLSNINYLGVNGVSPLFLQKQYRSIGREYKEYTDIKDKIISLKIKDVLGNDEKISKKVRHLENKLENHKLHGAFKRGFVNSLGSHLVANNEDSLKGLGDTMGKALKLILKNDKGNNNLFGKFIKDLSNIGGNGEVIIKELADQLKGLESTGALRKELNKLYETIKETKTDKDRINYLLQYTTSTSSGLVKFGSAITDISDLMAKETYFRHLREVGNLSEKEAEKEVIEAFPDYKENMPVFVKQLSDLGIVMFPSFWMNIQKPIYRMLRDKPINFGIEMMIEEAINTDFESIFDANIINKLDSYGGIFHSPHEPIGLGSFVPVNIL